MSDDRTAPPYTAQPFNEIQGVVASAYSAFPFMSCLLFHCEDRAVAVESLRGLGEEISYCDPPSQRQRHRLNLAMTWSGLLELNPHLPVNETKWFDRPYREGMVTAHRQRLLGDFDGSPNAPDQWAWGGKASDDVHLVLLVYESSASSRTDRVAQLTERLNGLRIVADGRIDSNPLPDGKEHFGFRDGVSQPWLEGLNRPGRIQDRVPWGDMILGYHDNGGTAARCPSFAENGTYLVIRQIEQDVVGFWQSIQGVDRDKLATAAKLMGRWPDGTPVTLFPDGPSGNATNDFDYQATDAQGLKCPLGAHIRRCNPREEPRNLHRILRRGRPYGPAAPVGVHPEGVIERHPKKVGRVEDKRGLLFMCLNADIERQYEFVQKNWINDSMVTTLTGERDHIASHLGGGEFTMPQSPFRQRISRMQPYTRIVGGGYFFVPSRTGIRIILNSLH